jgi:YebC/PmpR family DNA-binding regulatory protein
MAGHSHWANIQHKKGAADAKRGKLWSKLSRAIIIAAKNGGGDPATNLKLRYAIDKAREADMPKDTIERAIKKGTGELGPTSYDEITYEGFGPGGIAIMTEVLSDNRNRTNGEIRKIYERGGGNMGSAGCVSYLFERKGLITVASNAIDEDSLMAIVLDAGADDLKQQGDVYEITCDPVNYTKVIEALNRNKVIVASSEITQLPKTTIDAPDLETAIRVLRLIEALDDYDDVQNVYTNMTMSDEILAEASKS